MSSESEPRKYHVTEVAVSSDGECVYLGLDNGETFTLPGRCTLPQVGDYLVASTVNREIVVTLKSSDEPAVRVSEIMTQWQELGYARLRRLTYELKGFSSLMDDEQAAIFVGLPNATAIGMFIEECKHRNAYKHEQKYVRAIREVAKAHHLLS
jgi:hypothetical protein